MERTIFFFLFCFIRKHFCQVVSNLTGGFQNMFDIIFVFFVSLLCSLSLSFGKIKAAAYARKFNFKVKIFHCSFGDGVVIVSSLLCFVFVNMMQRYCFCSRFISKTPLKWSHFKHIISLFITGLCSCCFSFFHIFDAMHKQQQQQRQRWWWVKKKIIMLTILKWFVIVNNYTKKK